MESATKLVPDRPGELTAESCCGEGTPEMRRQVCKSNRRVTFWVSTEFHRWGDTNVATDGILYVTSCEQRGVAAKRSDHRCNRIRAVLQQRRAEFFVGVTMKRFPSSRCASTIQIVRPSESIAETRPQLHPALPANAPPRPHARENVSTKSVALACLAWPVFP